MTIQEAIENLRYLISDNCTDTQNDYVEEIELAIKTLERHIPRKPKMRESWYAGVTVGYCEKYYVCPECECGLRFNKDYHDSFCPNCGIKIDWSDEE